MPLKIWNGSSWTSAKSTRIWNGSSWTKFFPLGETQTLYVQAFDMTEYYPDLDEYQIYYYHGAENASISPGSSSIIPNATWWNVHWEYSVGPFFGGVNPVIYWNIKKPVAYGPITNSGWNTVTITSPVAGVTVFNRTDLIFGSYDDGVNYYATWATPSSYYAYDPFLDGTYNPPPQTVQMVFT